MAASAHLLRRVSAEVVERRIYLIRGEKVMIDSDLAALYQVTTGNLNLAVPRNAERFPSDFMFQLTEKEFENLILQSARSSCDALGSLEGRVEPAQRDHASVINILVSEIEDMKMLPVPPARRIGLPEN